MDLTARSLKVRARAAMADASPSPWIVTLLFFMLVTILPNIVTEIFQSSLLDLVLDVLSSGANVGKLSNTIFIGLFCSLIVFLITLIIQLGYSLWALRALRHEENGIGTIFEGFAMVGRIILSNLFVALYTFGWTLFLSFFLSLIFVPAMLADMSISNLPILIFYTITIAAAVIMITLRYTLVPYVLVDHPELPVFLVVGAAVRMLRGKTLKLFKVYFSFIGWYLLNLLITTAVTFLTIHLTTGQLMAALMDFNLMLTLASNTIPFWCSLVSSLLVGMYLTPYTTITIAGFYDTLIQPVQKSEFDNVIY